MLGMKQFSLSFHGTFVPPFLCKHKMTNRHTHTHTDQSVVGVTISTVYVMRFINQKTHLDHRHNTSQEPRCTHSCIEHSCCRWYRVHFLSKPAELEAIIKVRQHHDDKTNTNIHACMYTLTNVWSRQNGAMRIPLQDPLHLLP